MIGVWGWDTGRISWLSFILIGPGCLFNPVRVLTAGLSLRMQTMDNFGSARH